MPKQSTEIMSSFSGKISTGKWENENPIFSIRETWTEIDDEFLIERQNILHQMCYRKFVEVARKSVVEKLKKQLEDILTDACDQLT